jgi:hypothetical protein
MESKSTDKRSGPLPFRVCKEACEQVQKTYNTVRHSQPVGASGVYFELGEPHSQRLTVTGIEFICDVEKATNALGKPALLRTWARMTVGLPVDRQLENIVIQRCGEIYLKRGLAPVGRYFHQNRYRNNDRRQAA